MTLDLRAIPRVMRTPMVTTNALVAEGSMFVDGRKRIFVPKATTDELIAELTAALIEADESNDRVARGIEAVRGLFARTRESGDPS